MAHDCFRSGIAALEDDDRDSTVAECDHVTSREIQHLPVDRDDDPACRGGFFGTSWSEDQLLSGKELKAFGGYWGDPNFRPGKIGEDGHIRQHFSDGANSVDRVFQGAMSEGHPSDVHPGFGERDERLRLL
jgi:hypothetical protein